MLKGKNNNLPGDRKGLECVGHDLLWSYGKYLTNYLIFGMLIIFSIIKHRFSFHKKYSTIVQKKL